MKNFKCTFEAQKGNPNHKLPDFNPIKVIVVQSKFKSGARPIAEEELKLFDPEYPEKYRAPTIEQATDLELQEYESRKAEILEGVDNGNPEYFEPEAGEPSQVTIDVLEFPVNQPWKIRVGLVNNDGLFQTSMAIVNGKNNAIAYGNIETIRTETYKSADNAIVYALGLSIEAIIEHMADIIGSELDSTVKIIKGYCTLKEQEKLNRIKETILVNAGAENLNQQVIDDGSERKKEGDQDSMMMDAINECIGNYGDIAPDPEECYESLMLQVTNQGNIDIEAMSEAIRHVKNPFVMTHSTTSVNFVAGFTIENKEQEEPKSERDVPISAEGQSMLDKTAEESRDKADKDWPKGEPFDGVAKTVGERAPDYVYDTSNLWQALAHKVLSATKEQSDLTAEQYIEVGQKLEGVFGERNLELMSGEFFSEVSSEMINHASGADTIIATMLNLRELRKFVDSVTSHLEKSEHQELQANDQETEQATKDIMCSGVLTSAHQSVGWQLIEKIKTGEIGSGNTLTSDVIAGIFTAGCVECYLMEEDPAFDPYNVEQSAYQFYEPLMHRYCSGDLDPESIIMEYINAQQQTDEETETESVAEQGITIGTSDIGDSADSAANAGESVSDTANNECPEESAEDRIQDEIKELNLTLNALPVGQVLILDNLPNEVYHGAIGYSSSNIKEEIISSLYRHNRETGEIERTPKKCFDFGNYIHTLLLQPHLVECEYAFERELPEGGFDSTESLVNAIDEENKHRQPLASSDELKALIEKHNGTLPEKLSTSGSKEEVAFVFESMPEEFKLLAPNEKDNATTHKKYIKAYNDSLPPKLKTSGGRDSLLAEVGKFMPDFVKKESEKKPTLPTTGTKKDLAGRIRSFMPDAVFKHELDEAWKLEQEKGLIPVSLDDIEKGHRIYASAMNNPAVKNWYQIENESTACERSYFVKRSYPVLVNGKMESVDLLLKARLDKEIGGIIVDTKTIELRLDVKAEDAEMAINREIEKRGYHISAAHYLDVTGKDKFFWIFHNKLKGYEWEFVMEISPDHLELGQYELSDAVMSIANSNANNSFKAPITQPVSENGAPQPLTSRVTSYANSRLEMFRKMNGEEI